MLKMPKFLKSFVGIYIPTVWLRKMLNNPLVCSNNPFVRIGGFTLIELMVTLAVVAILALIAVPNFRPTIQNSRIVGLTNDLLSDINYARTEALKRAANVGICMSTSGTACDGGSWQSGRIVFADVNNDGAFNPGDIVLRVRERLDNNTLTSANMPNPIIFGSRGLPMTGPLYTSSWTSSASFSLCDDRGASKGRSIGISVTGQPSSSPLSGGC